MVSCGDGGEPLGPDHRLTAGLDDEPLHEAEDRDASGGPAAMPSGNGGPAPNPAGPPNRESDAEVMARDAGSAPRDDAYDVDPVCTSGTFWSRGYSEEMHPGGTCITCHAGADRAPHFTIAGTVYPTAHEPTDCNAANPAGVQVQITGMDGKIFLLHANRVGTFVLRERVALPYKARVLSQGRVREMKSAQSSGDCNSCHTQSGTAGAPGRVLLP